jgi:hypothetical protein
MQCGYGHDLDDGWDPPDGPRRPCPTCGSTARRHAITVTANVQTHASVGLKHRRPGVKRPLLETVSQLRSLFRLTGRIHLIDRTIDRVRDRYRERIVDAETGEIIREVDEPLSRHQGRGDARPDRR